MTDSVLTVSVISIGYEHKLDTDDTRTHDEADTGEAAGTNQWRSQEFVLAQSSPCREPPQSKISNSVEYIVMQGQL